MKRIFKIVKRIEAENIQNAIDRESKAEIIEVFYEPRENIPKEIKGFENK